MHPAYSVIFFTTASGAGYGMLVWLALLAATSAVSPGLASGIAAFAVALGLITAGLLSSTFHLGHPERAWRALSQWRSSWLSREGIAAIATYIPILVFAIGSLLFAAQSFIWIWAGMIAAGLCLVTVACTGMIYASLRAIPYWYTPLVMPLYIAFALASGAVAPPVPAAALGLKRQLRREAKKMMLSSAAPSGARRSRRSAAA